MPGEDDKPFSWGLTPKGDEPTAEAEPPADPAEVPTEPTPAIEPVGIPTEPFVPIAAPTERMPVAGPRTPDERMPPAEPGTPVEPDAETEHDAFAELFGASVVDLQGADLDARSAAEAPPPTRSDRKKPPGGRAQTTQVLTWVAAGLLAVILLIGLFVLGTRLPAMFAGAPTPAPTTAAATPAAPTPSATPAPSTPPPTGPQPAGVHAWNTLRGGECLQPYASPWEEKFTVVDCTTPHAAQLAYTGTYPDASLSTYPGADALAAQINVLCSAPGVLDLSKAGAYSDVQIQGSYPVDAAQWAKGQRSYFCFVSRASGDPMTISVAGAGPAK